MDSQKKSTVQIGKYTIHIVEVNKPSEAAIRNTNRKINEIMNNYYSKLDHNDEQGE